MSDADQPGDTNRQGRLRTPPYVSFKSLMTLIDELKTNGIPPQVDRSVLRRFSGGLGSQLVMALKSLGIIDDSSRPTERGERVIQAYGTDGFKPYLRAVLESGPYSFLSDLNLETATPSMFADAFKATGAKEDVLRKCRTFYLHAAQYAGIPIGPRLLSGSAPRSSGNGASKRKRQTVPKNGNTETSEHAPTNPHSHRTNRADKLLDKFPAFDPSWPDPIKEKWFEAYDRILKMEDTK